MTTLWNSRRKICQKQVDAMKQFWPEETDEEIRERMQSDAEDKLEYIQNKLDEIYPGPINVLAIDLEGQAPYYIMSFNHTGRGLMPITTGQQCHYYWDYGELRLHAEKKRLRHTDNRQHRRTINCKTQGDNRRQKLVPERKDGNHKRADDGDTGGEHKLNDWYVIVTNNRDLDVELTKFPSFNKACEAMLADLNDEKHTQTFGNKLNTQVTILPDNTGATLLTENGLEYTWRITTETKTDENWYMLTTNNRNDDVKLRRYENLVLAQQAMRQAMVTDAKRTKENGIRTKITIWPNDRGGRLTTETGASRTWHLIKLTED